MTVTARWRLERAARQAGRRRREPGEGRHEKDPVNLEQTAFVSSLVRAPPEATAPAPGPGPAGVHLDAPNGGSRVDAGGTSTETEAGQAGPGPTGAADGVAGR